MFRFLSRFSAPRALAVALIVATATTLSACSALTAADNSVCGSLTKLQTSSAVVTLDAQDPHSAGGVLWADLKSACTNGVPTAGVSTDWSSIVLNGLKTALPFIIPLLGL